MGENQNKPQSSPDTHIDSMNELLGELQKQVGENKEPDTEKIKQLRALIEEKRDLIGANKEKLSELKKQTDALKDVLLQKLGQNNIESLKQRVIDAITAETRKEADRVLNADKKTDAEDDIDPLENPTGYVRTFWNSITGIFSGVSKKGMAGAGAAVGGIMTLVGKFQDSLAGMMGSMVASMKEAPGFLKGLFTPIAALIGSERLTVVNTLVNSGAEVTTKAISAIRKAAGEMLPGLAGKNVSREKLVVMLAQSFAPFAAGVGSGSIAIEAAILSAKKDVEEKVKGVATAPVATAAPAAQPAAPKSPNPPAAKVPEKTEEKPAAAPPAKPATYENLPENGNLLNTEVSIAGKYGISIQAPRTLVIRSSEGTKKWNAPGYVTFDSASVTNNTFKYGILIDALAAFWASTDSNLFGESPVANFQSDIEKLATSSGKLKLKMGDQDVEFTQIS